MRLFILRNIKRKVSLILLYYELFFIEGKTRNFLYIQLGKHLELPATWDMYYYWKFLLMV